MTKNDIDWGPYFAPIMKHESMVKQFNYAHETFAHEPNWGPPLGWGLTQRDFKAELFPDGPVTGRIDLDIAQTKILWNWQDNVIAGGEMLREKSDNAEFVEASFRNSYNLPPLTKHQKVRCAVVLYNSAEGLPSVDGKRLSYVPENDGEQWNWSNFHDNVMGYWSNVEPYINWEIVPEEERPP